jgi:hypothetical protein
LAPVMAIKSSADMCGDAPVPDEAKLTLPGLAFTKHGRIHVGRALGKGG